MNKIQMWQWIVFLEQLEDYIKAIVKEAEETSIHSFTSKQNERELLTKCAVELLEIVEPIEEKDA